MLLKWGLPAFAAIITIGASFYIGQSYGKQACVAEKLAAKLDKEKEEARIEKELNTLEKDQINDAHDNKVLETKLNETLDKSLSKIDFGKSTECVPDVVLNELRKFRQRAKGAGS